MTDHQFVATFRHNLLLRSIRRESPFSAFVAGFAGGIVFAGILLLIS